MNRSGQTKHSFAVRTCVVLGGCLAVAVSAFGAIDNNWVGGDGSWNDPKMWSKESVPEPGHFVHFPNGVGGRVLLDSEVSIGSISFGKDGALSVEESPVEFYGGGKLTLTDSSSMFIYPGRTLILDHVTIDSTTFSLKGLNGAGSTLELREGSAVLPPGNASRNSVEGGSTLFICGGSTFGNLTLLANARFRMTSGQYAFTQKFSQGDFDPSAIVDITGGTIVLSSTLNQGHIYTTASFWPKFFPANPGAVLSVNSEGSPGSEARSVTLSASPSVLRLSGVLSATNCAPNSSERGTVYSDGNKTIWGGGQIDADQLYLTLRTTNDLCLSSVRLGAGLRTGTQDSILRFRGDTAFGAWGNWQRFNEHLMLIPGGTMTFDTDDCFDPSAAPHVLSVNSLCVENGFSSLKMKGHGSARLYNFATYKGESALRSLELAPTISFFEFRNSETIRDFVAGSACITQVANAVVSCRNASVLSDATFTVMAGPNTLDAGALEPVFHAAPGGEWPDASKWSIAWTDPAGTPGDWRIRAVGPSVFLSDGKLNPGSTESGPNWRGTVSGYLSNPDNWAMVTMKETGVDPYFMGEQRTVVTNDFTAFKPKKGLRFTTTAAPFVFRGNSITFTRATAATILSHDGYFPVIMECPLVFGAVADNQISVTKQTYIAAMGPVTDEKGANIQLTGEFLVGNSLAAKGLELQAKNTNARATTFSVLSTGNATFSNQTKVFSVRGILSVNGGGKLTFADGSFRWATVVNNHEVDGLLDIRCPLSGSCDIGFQGTGVVQVATMRSSPNGNAAVRLDGTVKLAPSADWTTVTEDSADTAITLALPKWGRATLAPAGDFTYGPASGVTPTTDAASRAFACGDYSELTVESDHAVAFADPLAFGVHAKLVKKGAGHLAISAADVLAESVKLEAGTLALSAPETVGSFTAAEGTTLELAAGASVTVTDEDLSLDGLTVSLAGAAPQAWTTLFTVSPLRTISGMPTLPDNVKAKFVINDDGSTSLMTKEKRGMMLLFR